MTAIVCQFFWSKNPLYGVKKPLEFMTSCHWAITICPTSSIHKHMHCYSEGHCTAWLWCFKEIKIKSIFYLFDILSFFPFFLYSNLLFEPKIIEAVDTWLINYMIYHKLRRKCALSNHIKFTNEILFSLKIVIF